MAHLINIQAKKIDELNLSRILKIFRERWYVIALTLIASLIIVKLYLRYTPPVFFSYATLKIEEKNTATSALGYFSDLENFNDNILSEIQILQSRTLIQSALDRMNLGVSYYKEGRVKNSEMYQTSPFEVIIDSTSNVPYSESFNLKYLGDNQFQIYQESEGPLSKSNHYFGENIDLQNFKFRINRKASKFYPLEKNGEFSFKINRHQGLASRARAGLKIEQVGYMVSILKISSKDFVPQFSADFVNSLCQVYLEYNQNNQRQAATRALEFIESQLDSLRDSLEASERSIERFLVGRDMVSVEQKIGDEVNDIRSLETAIATLEVKALNINRLDKEVRSGVDIKTMPYNLATTDASLLTDLVGQYNTMVQERLSALQSLTPVHPKVKDLDKRIFEVQGAIYENIGSLRKNNETELEYFRTKIRDSKQQLNSIPATQRGYVSLLREFEVRNKIYNNLLEKRAEAQIARESIIPSVRILDSAQVPGGPISPIVAQTYLLGIVLGFGFGVLLVLLSSFLKNTISYRDEVEAISLTPIIGVVRRSNVSLNHKYPRLQVIENPKSSLSESIRAIRTNLQFISANKQCRIISVTSSVSGEGKSFITINLGGIISILNKRVVILDLDLRKPKLHYSFGLDNSEGISTYLAGTSKLEEVIKHTEYDNLDAITSGPIPPNPAELVQSQGMERLLQELSTQYDFILIDTPPIGLVTDGATLLKMSDISLYVIRADYSKKPYARIPDQLAEEQKVKNLYIIINSVSQQGGRYTGYGYRVYSSGYYSEEEPRFPWWQFWKAFNRRRV